MTKYYAVKIGRQKGVYTSWDDCLKQVDKYSGAVYKSFKTENEALDFINDTPKVIDDVDIIAYVDGSYNIKTKEYGYGCVLISENKVIEQLSAKGSNEDYASMRNVAGEILGSLKAIEYAINHGYKGIAIYYDYEGIEKWANGSWKANKPGTIAYQQIINKYRPMINITFIKVLAHSGDTYNELADSLAKQSVGVK